MQLHIDENDIRENAEINDIIEGLDTESRELVDELLEKVVRLANLHIWNLFMGAKNEDSLEALNPVEKSVLLQTYKKDQIGDDFIPLRDQERAVKWLMDEGYCKWKRGVAMYAPITLTMKGRQLAMRYYAAKGESK